MLLPGDWVEVRPARNVLASLDADQALDALPFMPEMLAYCGTRRRVAMRAERTCINPPEVPFRQLRGAVVLEGARCDGSDHGGCQLGCMFLWKEAWLRPLAGLAPAAPSATPSTGPDEPPTVHALRSTAPGDPERYVCQATALPRATDPGEPAWHPGQYLHFLRIRTLTPRQLAEQVWHPIARRLRWAAERFLRRRTGATPATTPEQHLGLRAGEWVEVRSREEIDLTLDAERRCRGLAFSTDMYRLCGRRVRVAEPIERVVVEATGRLQAVRDTVVLEGSMCDRYRGCARGMPILWREAWLKRAAAGA